MMVRKVFANFFPYWVCNLFSVLQLSMGGVRTKGCIFWNHRHRPSPLIGVLHRQTLLLKKTLAVTLVTTLLVPMGTTQMVLEGQYIYLQWFWNVNIKIKSAIYWRLAFGAYFQRLDTLLESNMSKGIGGWCMPSYIFTSCDIRHIRLSLF